MTEVSEMEKANIEYTKAQARLLNAQAARIEKQNAADYK